MTALGWRDVPIGALYRRRAEVDRPELPLLSVYRDLGVVPREGREDNFNKPGEDLSSYQVVRPGYLVLNKMKTWQGSLGVSSFDGIVSPAYFVAEQVGDAEPRFMHHLLRSSPLIAEYAARSKGIRPNQWDLPWEEFRDIRVRLPSVGEQLAIADYLDAEVARIEAVAIAYRGQLDFLALRKRATVSQAMKASATAEVPVRRLVTTVTSGPRGWSGLEVEGATQLFLRIANVPADSIRLKLEDVAFIDAPDGDESDRCRVRPGDVLTTITAAIGQVAVVPADLGEAYVSQHLALLRPDPALVMPEWLALALWSDDAQRQLDAARYGGTKQQLSLDDIREVRVPLAEMTDQKIVVPRVLASLNSTTQAEQRIRRVIDLLLERRQALITAAVTGQLDIPGVAA